MEQMEHPTQPRYRPRDPRSRRCLDQGTRGPHATGGSRRRDAAVSPVVGMILVLGISVVGIATVLYWGLPAISNLQASVEFRAVVNQFEDLDSTVDELTRGTPGQTAKQWKPSFEQGSIQVVGQTERWVVVTDVEPRVNFTATGLFERDENEFTLTNNETEGFLDHVMVRAWTLDGGVRTPLNVSTVDASGDCTDPTPMGSTEWDLGTDQEKDLCLWHVNGTALDPDDVTLHIIVEDEDDGSDLSEVFVVDVGRVHYAMTLGTSQREAYHSNGALIQGRPSDMTVGNQPPFGPPRTTNGETRFFGRLVQLDGDTAVAGTTASSFNMLLSLYSTSTLVSAEDVGALKVWVDGEVQDPWYDHLTDTANDQEFVRLTDGDSNTYLSYEPADNFDLKLMYHIVTVQG